MAAQKNFQYGRAYQLVIDKTKAVPNVQGRAMKVQEYIKTRSRAEIITEANNIINHTNKKADWVYIWNYVEKLDVDDEYYGRCVQFLLDSDYTVKIATLIAIGQNAVVKRAHETREKQLLPAVGTLTFDTTKECGDACGDGSEDGSEGCSWTYGDKRCSKDNKKYSLGWEPLKNLDTPCLCFYPEED